MAWMGSDWVKCESSTHRSLADWPSPMNRLPQKAALCGSRFIGDALPLLPLGNRPIRMPPQRIPPVGDVPATLDHQLLVHLDAEARAGERLRVAALVELEGVLIEHVVQDFAALVVVDAHAL